MKILAFAGSNSNKSINKQLVEYTMKQFEGEEIDVLDLNHYEMPLYGIDKELENGIPALASEFASKIDNSDLLIISLAEHNSSYTVAFKNIFDWISRIPGRKHFGEKPMFIMSTSPGGGGGIHALNTLVNRVPHSGSPVIESFSLPRFNENFNTEDGILNKEKRLEFETKISTVKNFFLKK